MMADLSKTGKKPVQAAYIQHTLQRPYPYQKQDNQKQNKRGPKTRAECINNLRKKSTTLKPNPV